MEKKEFAIMAKAINEMYGADTISSTYSMELWYSLLKDLPYDQANTGLLKYMQSSSYKPKPADIRRAALEVSIGYQESGNEVWQRIDKIVRSLPIGMDNVHEVAREKFAALPVQARRLLGNENRLIEMAKDYTLQDYESARMSFVRDYRGEEAREKDLGTVSPSVRALMEMQKTGEAVLEDHFGEMRGRLNG